MKNGSKFLIGVKTKMKVLSVAVGKLQVVLVQLLKEFMSTLEIFARYHNLSHREIFAVAFFEPKSLCCQVSVTERS